MAGHTRSLDCLLLVIVFDAITLDEFLNWILVCPRAFHRCASEMRGGDREPIGVQRRVPNFQRRLVTIVSADVAGFSRLTAGDEVETLTTWRAYFRIAHNMAGAHDGRIFGSAGDSFMIEFERPFDAVQFAVAFQSRLARENASLPIDRRMEFQLGINIGDVLIEEDRLFGDEVNIAARLQERADPGGIVVADVVRSHVASRVACEFQDLGELELYNIPQRVRA